MYITVFLSFSYYFCLHLFPILTQNFPLPIIFYNHLTKNRKCVCTLLLKNFLRRYYCINSFFRVKNYSKNPNPFLNIMNISYIAKCPARPLASLWIRVDTIVIYLVIQNTSTIVNDWTGYSAITPEYVLLNLSILNIRYAAKGIFNLVNGKRFSQDIWEVICLR